MKDDDRELFRRAVKGVKPLARPAPLPQRERRRPRAASRRADEAQVLADSLAFDAVDLGVETGEELGWRRPGVPESVLRRLRRGHYACRDELDLHGMTRAEAREALTRFLGTAVAHGWHCVRIIHGKGRGSGHRGPVLKTAVNRWLRRHEVVRAFASARRNDGGTGALYALLHR
ncbi:MAG: Smr/MutS family protein [Gammaproteobacteria bacterium]